MIRTTLALAIVASSFVGLAPAHAACTPASTSITPNALTWRRWANDTQVMFEWQGSGLVVLSDDCASSLDVYVQVTDDAPYGSPRTVEGYQGRGTDRTASDGEFRAYATSDDFVLYYDALALSVRGPSTVEVRVSATYVDAETQGTTPLGCAMSHSSVTPLPTGPLVSTGPVESCS